jgi:hypothetical protein
LPPDLHQRILFAACLQAALRFIGMAEIRGEGKKIIRVSRFSDFIFISLIPKQKINFQAILTP